MNIKHIVRSYLLCLLFISIPILSHGGQPSISANQLKAVYLYNFLHFVSWPEICEAHDGNKPLTIGIIGTSPVGSALDDLAETISQNRKQSLKIMHYNSGEDITNCQILFVSQKEAHHFQDILTSIKAPLLTVAETEDFLNNGGMITMLTVKGKIRYKINHTAAKAVGLRLNSQLLKTALEVH